MKQLAAMFWKEPAIAVGILTAVTAAAAGVWTEAWIAFLAAAFAGIGAVIVRQNVKPVDREG